VPFAFDEFVFDEGSCELRCSGALLKADARVLELLAYLLLHPGRLVTKEELIDEVWQGRVLGDNVISVCVAKLRKVLGGPSNRCIRSVYGQGYRFLRPVQQIEPSAVHAAPAPPPPSPATAASSGGPPLVGRELALGRLQAALERARAGRGAVCALLGEAGIGKTRLAEVLEERAEHAGFRVSWGRCHALSDAPPLWPWLQVIRSSETQLPVELRSRALEQVMRGPEVDGDVPQSAWEPRAAGSWQETLTWTSRVVAHMTAARPWLIVLEDMQWADAASLQLLAHLVAEIPQLPLLLVLTVRDTELPPEHRSRLALDYALGHRDCERIALPRLQPADVARYTTLLFGGAQRALADAVFAQSEGNPFFMVELMRPFADGPAPAPSALSLSGPSLDIVRQGLRRLAADAREVLGAAAIIGRSFDLGLLSAVTGHDGEALLELLEDAMSSHIVVAARESHTDFAFGHDLMRSVLYEELGSVARIRLHQRVAEVLSRRQPPLSASASAELAHHLLSALPSGDVSHAVSCARQASRSATRIGAHADACAFLRRALDALRLSPEADLRTHCNLLFELASSERAAGDPAFVEHLARAVELAREHGFGEILAWAGQAMSAAPGAVVMEGASTVLEAALEELPASNQASRAVVLAHLSWTPPHCLDATRVALLLRDAQVLAEGCANEAALRAVLQAKLYFAGGPDDYDKALAIATEIERLGASRPALQRERGSIELRMARIVALLQRGELARAQQIVDDLGSTATKLQHAELIWHYERMCAVMHMNTGDFEHAKTALTELKDRAERGQLHARKMVEAIDWGELLRQTTDITPFAAQLADALRPDASDTSSASAYKLHALVQLGLLDEASAALQALPIAALYRLPKSRDYLATLGHLASVSAATRSLSHAAALYELLQPYPRLCVASLSLHCYGVVSYFLGILARTLGRRESARAHFEEAIVEHERLGLQPHLARTRYELAQLLIDSGEPEDRKRARILLTAARDSAQRLTMEPLRMAADELLSSVTASLYN
jgi:DNA-binding winged helix-turn-helix (wHTH) protein/tetratricopeptide (TPR) repeat protein